MAFYNLPTFNLLCNIYSWDGGVGLTLRVPNVPCQLQNNWKHAIGNVFMYDPNGMGSGNAWASLLKVPALTDVHTFNYTAGLECDQVECPAGSGRFYTVNQVDDCAKGFPNEYRIVLLGADYFSWPNPAP